MAAFPLPGRVHVTSNSSVRFRALVAQFGDGYSQRLPDGLNASIQTWNVVWRNLIEAERDTVLGVLNSVGAWDVIEWTPPYQTQLKKFILPADVGYSIQYARQKFSISTQMVEVFDP